MSDKLSVLAKQGEKALEKHILFLCSDKVGPPQTPYPWVYAGTALFVMLQFIVARCALAGEEPTFAAAADYFTGDDVKSILTNAIDESNRNGYACLGGLQFLYDKSADERRAVMKMALSLL